MADSLLGGLAGFSSSFSALANIGSGIAGYFAASKTSKAQQAFQNWQNSMTQLSGATNQNAITENELSATKQLATQGIGLQSQEALTVAKVQVSAAAAGVGGNSVDQAQLSVQANAAVAERQREISLNNVYLSADQQQLGNEMQVQAKQNMSFIPTPQIGNYLLPAVAKNFSLPGILGNPDPKASQAGSSTGSSIVNPLSSTYTPGSIIESDLPPALR